MIVNRCSIVLALFCVMAAAGAARAGLMIDSFNTGEQSLEVRATSPNATSFVWGLLGSEVIGGSREVTLEWVAGTNRTFADVNLDANGRLDFAQGPNAEARLTILWDGDELGGAGNLAYALGADLTADGATGFVANVVSIDLPIRVHVEVFTDANNGSVFEGTWSAGQVGAQYLPFNHPDWSVAPGATGPADFTQVGQIRLILDGDGFADADVAIDYVATGVPEPSSLALAILGAAMLVAVRRRRR